MHVFHHARHNLAVVHILYDILALENPTVWVTDQKVKILIEHATIQQVKSL